MDSAEGGVGTLDVALAHQKYLAARHASNPLVHLILAGLAARIARTEAGRMAPAAATIRRRICLGREGNPPATS
jgi:hypothetical protein